MRWTGQSETFKIATAIVRIRVVKNSLRLNIRNDLKVLQQFQPQYFKAKMADLSTIDCKDAVRAVVRRRLKEIGIKAPKIKLRTEYKMDHVSLFVLLIKMLCISFNDIGEPVVDSNMFSCFKRTKYLLNLRHYAVLIQ